MSDARIAMAILARGRRIEDLQNVIDAVTLIDRHQLRMGYAPSLYESGVVYRRERHGTLPGLERVQSAEETFLIGYGDCDDLAPWRAAELQLQGVEARAEVIRSPGVGYHVVVRLPSGRIEDPSARLGMLRAEEIGLEEQAPAVRRRRRGAFLSRARDLLQFAKRTPHVQAARAALKEAKAIYQAVDNEPDPDGESA
jgi:hypothetical protein